MPVNHVSCVVFPSPYAPPTDLGSARACDLKAHALVYALVNLAVWAIWAVIAFTTDSWWPWPVFMSVFWAIGLAMNAWDAYFRKPVTEQELQREIQRLQRPH